MKSDHMPMQFSDVDGDIERFFYRTAKTRELDDLLGDIYHKILGLYFELLFYWDNSNFELLLFLKFLLYSVNSHGFSFKTFINK